MKTYVNFTRERNTDKLKRTAHRFSRHRLKNFKFFQEGVSGTVPGKVFF